MTLDCHPSVSRSFRTKNPVGHPRILPWLALALAALLTSACVSPATQPLNAARAARSSGDLAGAARRYQEALAVAPGHKLILSELEEVRGELVDRAITEANTRAGERPDAAHLREALAILEQARAYGQGIARHGVATRGYESALEKLTRAQEARASQARAALQAGDLARASRQLDAIRGEDPAWGGLAALQDEVASWKIAHLTHRAGQALDAGDIPAARRALQELEGSTDPKLGALRARLHSVELDWLENRAAAQIARDQYYTCFLEIMDSGREDELQALLRRVRSEGADHYLEQARMRLSRGESGRAYLEAMKGLELSPGDLRLFDVHRDARDRQLASIQTYIAVPTFATPSARPDLGAQFSDALISHLFRVLPYGVNIVEREKIDLLLREQKSGFADLGEVLNVHLIISGNVSLMQIDRQESHQKAIARIQVGERVEVNPAFEIALKTAPRLPNGRVDSAALPTPTITIPLHETVKYNKGSVTLKGFSTVAARIFSTREAAIIYAQEFNARFDATDSFQDAVEDAGIEGDPLVLPTETEMVEALRTELVQKVAGLIEAQFHARHETYLEDARYRLARHERDQAMEPLASGFLYAVKAKVPEDDPAYGELLDLIVAETETGFLRPGDLADTPAIDPGGVQ